LSPQLRAITFVVIPDATFLRNIEQREVYLSGLRLAAGETPGLRPARPANEVR